jgi:cytochrome P450
VVGPDRLPTFEDLPSLGYIRAIVSETLRWRPVAVLGGTPHATTADDVYKGMFIPKGSTVIAPLWSSKFRATPYFVSRTMSLTSSVHLNEADFPDPHQFQPERFLEKREYPGTLGHSAFGWGRRICPGLHLGSASVAINIARILWAFDVSPARNEKGEEVEVDM